MTFDPTYQPFPEQDLASLAEHFEQLAERAMLKNALPATEAGIALIRQKAAAFLDGQVDPEKLEDIAVLLTKEYHGGDFDESHGDIGGDPTDDFIKDIEDPDFDRGMGESADDKLLAKMLTIAGVR